MVVISARSWLFHLFAHLRRAQGLVLVVFVHDLRLLVDVRLHYDDSTAVHQLQIEVSGAFAVAYDDLQGVEYVYR